MKPQVLIGLVLFIITSFQGCNYSSAIDIPSEGVEVNNTCGRTITVYYAKHHSSDYPQVMQKTTTLANTETKYIDVQTDIFTSVSYLYIDGSSNKQVITQDINFSGASPVLDITSCP